MFTCFPGGLWIQADTAPPTLLTPASAMAVQDLAPFKRAVLGGARMLLVGNILTPHLDKDHGAASISPKVMKGLLRDDLLYPGIIVAAASTVWPWASGAPHGDAAVAALKAGADMLLCSSRASTS